MKREGTKLLDVRNMRHVIKNAELTTSAEKHSLTGWMLLHVISMSFGTKDGKPNQ